MNQSPAWKFNAADLTKWLQNTLIFLAPVAAIYLGFVIANINNNVALLASFVPNRFISGVMILYLLNVAMDFFRKLTNGNPVVPVVPPPVPPAIPPLV